MLLPEYLVWVQMRRRCCDPKHHGSEHYLGRGITVCDRWNSFDNFLADMGPRPPGKSRSNKYSAYTLERRDNDKGYSPDNCYWATWKEQYANKRVRSPWNRLTPDQARAIRFDPRRPYKVIAADYGVTRHMVGMIIRGDVWKEI